jgi:hypothetical protein
VRHALGTQYLKLKVRYEVNDLKQTSIGFGCDCKPGYIRDRASLGDFVPVCTLCEGVSILSV